jgi:uncharacterized membrane protein SpoIIM required for sporulation
VIIDLQHFLATERPVWNELEEMLNRMERATSKLDLTQLQRFNYLYQRTASDLSKVSTFSAHSEIQGYLESLVARAYSEIHAVGEKPHRFTPLHWFFVTFPSTFRRHANAFHLALGITIVGAIFSALAVRFDPESKAVFVPPQFSHLFMDPNDRVAEEEAAQAEGDRMAGQKGTFAGHLMVNNTRVSINAMVFGITWGIGTMVLLFYNGCILGLVMHDYITAGQSVFLAGWLLPHGSIELPAIFIGGQAGLVIAAALIGRNRRKAMGARLREIAPDLVTLIIGVALMLVWAGIIEAFFSQYHEPIIPYAVKIAFGTVQLLLLIAYLTFSGRKYEAA